MIHPFEEAGLGRAPFTVGGWERRVGPIRLPGGVEIGAPGQPMGTCDFCGQGIAICVTIKSADNKRFIVGCDCVKKVDRDDNKMSTEIDRIKAEIRREQADKRRQERQAEWERQREAELQAQRDRNGGLTDVELAEKKRAEKAAEAQEANQWIIDVLVRQHQGDFIRSMISDLKRVHITELSDRCQDIIGDIVAKDWSGGKRRGSKAFEAAKETFWEKIDA